MMILINVQLTVKPEQNTAYLAFVEDLVAKSRQDQGVLHYGHYQQLDQPYHYAIIEQWQNQAAVDAHNQTSHLQQFIQEIDQFLAEPYQLLVTEID